MNAQKKETKKKTRNFNKKKKLSQWFLKELIKLKRQQQRTIFKPLKLYFPLVTEHKKKKEWAI